MKLAVPPYGQTKRAARHRQMKNNWPEKIISFEAWCAYTYYNPGEGPHGGEKFQKLMNYLLVNGSAWNANTVVELATAVPRPIDELGRSLNLGWLEIETQALLDDMANRLHT